MPGSILRVLPEGSHLVLTVTLARDTIIIPTLQMGKLRPRKMP